MASCRRDELDAADARSLEEGSALNDDGEVSVSPARQGMHEVQVMQTDIEALSAERGSDLSVAARLTVAEFMLSRWIGEPRTRFPSLHPLLRVVNSEHVADLVRCGDADAGLIKPRSCLAI